MLWNLYNTLKEKKIYFTIGLLAAVLLVGVYFVAAGLFDTKVSYIQSTEAGEHVAVQFGPFVDEETARERFSITPRPEGELVWLEEYNELHFMPESGFQPGREYRVTVSGTGSFVAAISGTSKNFSFIPPEAEQAEAYVPRPLDEDRYIDVNLSTMKLSLIENGKVAQVFDVAGKGNPYTGPSREGTFRVRSKELNHFSSISNVWMPYSMQYSGDYFIHEWPYWPGGRRLNSTYSLGCIRLHVGDAEKVYNWAEVGTAVVVHSTQGRLPVVDVSQIQDGGLVKEKGDARVFIAKHVNGERYKRHVWTTEFELWYNHLNPFWDNVKVVRDGALEEYTESRWIRQNNSGTIYEIDAANRTKHRVMCGTTPLSGNVSEDNCLSAWENYGWDPDEIYTVSAEELNVYTEGAPVVLEEAKQ